MQPNGGSREDAEEPRPFLGCAQVFEGEWRIAAYDPKDPTHQIGGGALSAAKTGAQLPSLRDFGSFLSNALHKPDTSIVVLSQDLLPALVPPPPLDAYVRKIAANVTRSILSDLQAEARRINDAKKKKREEEDKAWKLGPWRLPELPGTAPPPPRAASLTLSWCPGPVTVW